RKRESSILAQENPAVRTALVKLPRRISPKPIINDCAAWPTPVSTKTSFVTARCYHGHLCATHNLNAAIYPECFLEALPSPGQPKSDKFYPVD
ncbi:hypothetical protein DPT71_25275, partial [Salmonella enterica subsp. enterica serovar Monschaui]|nr:hypothetical protein [Salmonella enterica subsp. enterica serovar Monschaui]EBS4065055.1 hypothetical protein [Salmonella enterica subsp. enterica serovar Monschaui]EDA9038113.1 hypothetical protein [Salmonella enterica subsp. enterica serovar Monschaui]EDW0328060.1 hypothetical protein [Salmonella enterica subsp. enterica]